MAGKKNITRIEEPNFSKACEWWPDLPNIWTPIGWREHMFRFNVLYNGTILAKPDLNRRTEKYAGQGVQLGFAPHWTNWWSEWPHPYLRHDDGQVKQGWVDHNAPVLWTEWWRDGVLLRQYVFAHVPGGQEVQTGIEPLFGWIRLEIYDICPALPVEERHGFNLLFHAPHLSAGMSTRDNIQMWAHGNNKDKPYSSIKDEKMRVFAYPRDLKPDIKDYDGNRPLYILEPDGRVRLALCKGFKNVTVEFFDPREEDSRPCHRFYIQMPAKKGTYVDVLLPMLPCERDVFDKELALGYEKALSEAGVYWRKITSVPTRINVPEKEINEAIKHSVRFSNILSERNPETGKLCKINGSWVYADLWTTPMSMDTTMMMETLGYHKTVERYLEIFREEQGTVVPPGSAYEKHPGYLSTPALYKSIDWLCDNGAVLWVLSMHYLLSGDKEYANKFVDCIVKSCEWIKAMRAKKGHKGYEGVLPPAVASDYTVEIQAVWAIGWNYKGLTAAVRVLKEINHPRAAEFEEEARLFKEAYIKALKDKCRKMPVWKDANGKKRMFVPVSLAGKDEDQRGVTRHAFYLDAGPLFNVFAGLLTADDPLMQDTLAWFREGPARKYYRRDSNCWQVPVLDHEMSSCEPCYSWNVFFSWQMGDREKFLEGMYSIFAGSLSRKTWISCETRGGITGNVFSAPLGIYMARLAVIDDQIKPGELHLLRLIPLAWLKAGDKTEFKNMPTEYGPVTLQTKVSRDGKELAVKFESNFRMNPRKIILHIPPILDLKKIMFNGKVLKKNKKCIVVSS